MTGSNQHSLSPTNVGERVGVRGRRRATGVDGLIGVDVMIKLRCCGENISANE
jgi:hypothetical protein